MSTTQASVWPINEKGEVVAVSGTGSTNIVGYINQDSIALDSVSNKFVIAGIGGSQATISGNYRVGQTLTAIPSPGYTFTAGQWKRGNTNISGATGLTYVQTSADIGLVISFTPTNPVYSAIGGVTTVAGVTVPGAPTIGSLVGGDGKATANWTAPADNGGSPLTGFKITASNGQIVTTAASATSVDVPGSNGSSLTVFVQALNSIGYGPQSATSNSALLSAAVQNFDVVVYGASWPGVAAAIRAKQQGRSVLLIDPRGEVGGMTVSGIQFTDAHSGPTHRFTIPESSLSNKLFAALANTYGIGQQDYFRSYSYSSESKTTKAQILAMLAAAGISPVLNCPAVSIVKSGTVITSVTFAGYGVVNGLQFIDGSYTSDLLGMSGADYFLGGEAAATYSESTQQAGFVTNANQPSNPVDPYVTPGNPASGLIKYVQPGSITGLGGTAVPNLVQFPGYRLSITNTTGKKVPFPAPTNYVASDYEVHRRDSTLNKQFATTIANYMNLQSNAQIPSTTSGMTAKRDANNNGTFSLDFPDAVLSSEYFTPGTTAARRLEIEEIAWQYTLGWLYFLQNDSSVPAAVRTDVATYGFVNDDYLTTGGRPPLMYPREGIRAVGVNPIKASDITALNTEAAPVALSYYAFDKHARQYRISSTGGDHVIQEGLTPNTITASTPGARIGMRILDPKGTQVSNLQCLWGLNCSQMAYNAIRVEPIVACLGEAAGIRAALAVSTNTAVQSVPFSSVAPIQNLYGLDTVGALTITSDQTTRTNGTMTFQGTWTSTATNVFGTVSLQTTSATSGTNSFTCTPTIATAGNYKVQIKYSDSPALTRGNISVVATASGTAQAAVVINQNSATAGITTNGDWQTIGTYAFTAGAGASNLVVGTYDNSGNPANIAAVRFVPA